MHFYQRETDSQADTFFIDPDENNPRAQHVYHQAGFKKVGQCIATQGAFVGNVSNLTVKKLLLV